MIKKIVVVAVLLGALGFGGYLLFFNKNSEAQATGYRTDVITRGNLEVTVSSTGVLSAVRTVDVGSQVSGILESVLVDFNDQVTAGQTLATLDSSLFEAAVQDAEAGYERAKALYKKAQAELKRGQELHKKGYLSESELLVLETDVETNRASVRSAEATLFRARTNLSYAVITSPIDGTVIERAVDAGQTIASSYQTPKLFIIAEDLKNMQIEVDVDEGDIGQITQGLPVRFTVQAYPEETFTGTVRQVRLQPETIQNVVNYTVVVDARNDSNKLLPGMTATVDFIITSVTDALLVPNGALNVKLNDELKQLVADAQDRADKRGASPDDNGAQPRNGADRSVPAEGRPGAGRSQPAGEGAAPNVKRGKDVLRIFIVDPSDEKPRVVMAKVGKTDGKNSELVTVLGRTEVGEGTKVITGLPTSNSQNKSMSFSFGAPPAGRSMRRTGL